MTLMRGDRYPAEVLIKAFININFGNDKIAFILFDIMYDTEVSLSINEIIDRIEEKLSVFETPMEFDESTVRKKLKEYLIKEGVEL